MHLHKTLPDFGAKVKAVAIHVDFSIPGDRVAEILNVLKEQGKMPKVDYRRQWNGVHFKCSKEGAKVKLNG